MRLRLYTYISLLTIFIGVLLSTSSCFRNLEADLIIRNAIIYTVDDNFSVFEAMAIKDGKILELGKENQILNKYKAKETLDAKMAYIFPGLIDAHCHFSGYGLNLQQLDLRDSKSMEEVVAACKKFALENQDSWLTGRGWDQTKWQNKNFPNNTLLNEAFPDKPVLLRRVDGHAGIANSKALALAGITEKTKIPGGHIEILDGKLTGIVMDKALDFFDSIIPQPSELTLKKALIAAQQKCFAAGITSIQDAGLNKKVILLIDRLLESGELKMNCYLMASDNRENFDYFLDTVGQPIYKDRLTVSAFKFYGDGAMGSRGACLIKPYSDVKDSSHYGMLLSKPTYFKEKATQVYAKDFQMCTHCIGDSAARLILNIYGEILGGVNDKRWRIEHAQLVDSADFELFRKYTIIPSVQPTHATSDMGWAALRLGLRRVKFGYAYKDLLQQTGMIALGTDFPVEDIDPLATFYSAVARKNRNGHPKNGFQIENALTRQQTLKGMTIWAAMAAFEENKKGSLEKGKQADFVILNQDIMTIPEDQIFETKVLYTFVHGEMVYKR